MGNAEIVECKKNIDTCEENIKTYEETLKNSNKQIKEGMLGILIGVISLIMGFFYTVCWLGLFFGLAGLIMWISNIGTRNRTEKELESAKSALRQWKEKLYNLES